MKIRTVLKNCLLIALMAVCGSRGPNMPYSAIVGLYDSLLLALGVLCCVLGVWGSFLCPAALKRACDPDRCEGSGKHASEVTMPLSGLLVLFLLSLFIAISAPILKTLNISDTPRAVIKACAAGLSVGIFFVLCSAMFGMIGLVDTFQRIVNHMELETKMRARSMNVATRIRDNKKN